MSMLPLSQSPKKSCYFALPVAESLLFLFFSLSKNDEKSHEMFELLLQDCFSSPDATKNMLIAGWFDPILLPPQLDTSHCLHRLGDFILNLILQKEVIVSTYKSSLVFSLYSLAYHACFVLMTPENGTDESSVASCFEALLPLLLDLKHDFWGILEIDEAFDSIYEVIPYCTTWSIPRMELLKQRCRAIQQGAREPRTLLSTSSYITKRPVQEGDLPKQASNKSTLMDIGNGYVRATSALNGYISPASNTGQMPHARSSWIPKPKRKGNQGGDDEEDLLPPTPAHYSGEENPPKTTIKVEVKIEDDVKIEEAVHKKFRIKF